MNQYDLLKEGTTSFSEALNVWGAGNIVAGVKCSYAELYLADGTKIFSLQKSASVNTGHRLLIPTGNRVGNKIEVKLTRECYNFLTKIITLHNEYTDGKYAKIVPFLYIEATNGYQKSYRDIAFYVNPDTLRYFGKANATNSEQGTVISQYEVDEHNREIQEEIDRQEAEIAKKKKQITLLALVAGAISLMTFN